MRPPIYLGTPLIGKDRRAAWSFGAKYKDQSISECTTTHPWTSPPLLPALAPSYCTKPRGRVASVRTLSPCRDKLSAPPSFFLSRFCSRFRSVSSRHGRTERYVRPREQSGTPHAVRPQAEPGLELQTKTKTNGFPTSR